nr:DUF3450 domain-containing protein [uncultured Desulfuromonas sp.]
MNLYRLLNSTALLLCTATAWAQSFPDQVTTPVAHTLEVRQQAQKQDDAWQVQREKLLAQLEQFNHEKAQLQQQCAQLDLQVSQRQQRIAALQQDLVESARLTDEMVPFLSRVVDQLAQQVKADLPFLGEERRQRLSHLSEALEDGELSVGEKFRRVFEALQVEAAYGRRFDVVQKSLTINGQSTLMNELQVGRLALFAQSLDGQRSAVYDPVSAQWMVLDDSVNGDLRKAVEMAGKHRPVDLLNLPLGKVVAQ